MARFKYLLVALGVIGVAVVAFVVFKPHAGACEERSPGEEPELERRGSEILGLLRKDAGKFWALGTDAQRARQSVQQMSEFRDILLPALKTPERLTAVWKFDRFFNLKPQDSVVALCAVGQPYSDTLRVPGSVRDGALLIYELEREPLGMRIAIQLHREGDDYRWEGISVHPLSHRRYVAGNFESKADVFAQQGKDLDAIIAYLAAQKLSYVAANVGTNTGSRIAEKLAVARTSSKLKELMSRASIPREHEFLNLAMDSHVEKGLIPVVSFASSQVKEATRPEARALYEALVRLAPSLREDYAAVAMKAFPEPPRAGREYTTFGTLIETQP